MNLGNGYRTAQKESKLAEEAAEWLERLQSGGASVNKDYVEWLLESPRHVEAFLRVSEVDASLQKVDPERTLVVERSPPTNTVTLGATKVETVERLSARAVFGGRWFTTLAACGAFLGLIATGVWAFTAYQAQRWQEYVSATGAERNFVLDDGSVMNLAPASRVTVRFTSGERAVRLESGEALFRVHHDKSRPFRVRSGGITVEAVGTAFAVRQRAFDSVVSVLEGRVRVEAGHSAPASDRQHGVATESLFLGAGEQARLSDAGQLEGHGKIEPAMLSAARHQRLAFMNESLDHVITEFNRFNPSFQIRVDASGRSALRYVTGSFEADDPESFVAVLQSNPQLVIERSSMGVVVRAR